MEGIAAETTDWAEAALNFDALVREHQSMVFSIALRLVRNAATAEELAQDVFLELHRHLHRLESPRHARFWLQKVVTQRALDRTRRRWWQRERNWDPEQDFAAPDTSRDVLAEDRAARLLASLPERLRAPILLRYQEDLGPSEIAEVLGIPVRTVKGHLAQAIEFMRRKEAEWTRATKP